jgi:hypothetical protein
MLSKLTGHTNNSVKHFDLKMSATHELGTCKDTL